MPIFEYLCQDCGKEFETFVTGDRKPACPACHGANLGKLLSTPGMVGAGERSGSASSQPIGAREAVRIFTGAPMPEGTDTVFMQEDVRPDGGEVIVPVGLKRGANRRLAGEDVRKGAVVLPAGRRLGAQDVALAAAVGLTALDVRRRVRVALFSTGDEIVEPGRPRPAAALYDANRYLLAGMLDRLGETRR